MCMTDGDAAGKRSAIVLDLFDRYYERVHAFARRSVDANVAEDVTQEAFTRLLQHPRVAEELAVVDITEPMDLVALFQMDRASVLDLSERAPLNTDDNMLIEYSAPLHLHVDTSHDNFRLLLHHAGIPFYALPSDPLVLADLARTYQDREDPVRSVRTMAEAVRLLPEGDALREELLSEAERWQAELMADDEVAEDDGAERTDDAGGAETDPVDEQAVPDDAAGEGEPSAEDDEG